MDAKDANSHFTYHRMPYTTYNYRILDFFVLEAPKQEVWRKF